MRVLTKKTGLAACLIGAAAASMLLSSTSASATSAAPRTGDVVGVGSDTLQNAANFLFDSAPGVAGGYNNIGNNHRVYSFDATGDANGRAVYDGTCGTVIKPSATGLAPFCDSTNLQTPNLLPATSILRAGTNPVTNPNGSGAGAAALVADGVGGAGYQGLSLGSLQFARMSRLPNSTEIASCTAASPCGGLHVYQAATDALTIVHSSGTYDGPAGLSATELANIYDCTYTKWSDIPGNSSGSTATIHALIPQSGSGTRNFFLADLVAAKPSFVLGTTCGIRTVEEHDPTGVYGDPKPADAIEPFSSGKLALINSGYFTNAGYANASGFNAYSASPNNALTALSGAAPDAATSYNVSRGLYFVIRDVDLNIAAPFQTGGTGNWATVLFAGSASVIAKSANKPQIQFAGFTPAYKDCGVNPASC